MSRQSSLSPSSSSSDGGFGFMEEPAMYRPATPPPTIKSYARRALGGSSDGAALIGPAEVDVGLVSGHPLWGHILYPAAIAMSRFLELHAAQLLRGGSTKGKGKAVLELGAGGGLPGLVAALEGADKVVISDFPDPSLVNNLQKNVENNVLPHRGEGAADTHALGFTWGSSPTPLFDSIQQSDHESRSLSRKFDLILLSDLVFNHSQHGALLDTCLACLSGDAAAPASSPPLESKLSVDLSPSDFSTPAVLCFFSHHRPTEALIEADLGILKAATERGWKVEKVWLDEQAGPAFPEDGGDLAIRSTVHGFAFTRG